MNFFDFLINLYLLFIYKRYSNDLFNHLYIDFLKSTKKKKKKGKKEKTCNSIPQTPPKPSVLLKDRLKFPSPQSREGEKEGRGDGGNKNQEISSVNRKPGEFLSIPLWSLPALWCKANMPCNCVLLSLPSLSLPPSPPSHTSSLLLSLSSPLFTPSFPSLRQETRLLMRKIFERLVTMRGSPRQKRGLSV